MDREKFWKNFKLGEELQIAGRFIFNGLRTFHEMQHLYNYDEVFETLYCLAVGLERILKVAIILTEDGVTDQDSLEKSLITHDHQSLLARLRKTSSIEFSTVHYDFIALLSTFYNTHRYDRYVLASMIAGSKEKIALHRFFEKHLKIDIRNNPPFDVSPNTDQMRRFLGRTVGKLSKNVYDLIYATATNLGIFTYEVRSDSKAAKIFLAESYDFLDEDILWRELLIFFMNEKSGRGVIKFLRETEPLPFDPGLASEFLDAFSSTEKMINALGELDAVYDGVDSKKDRIQRIRMIGDPAVVFSDELEDEEDVIGRLKRYHSWALQKVPVSFSG